MSLTHSQMRALAIEARKAWDALPPAERRAATDAASEADNDPLGVSPTRAFEWWRHREQQTVTGKASLRDMSNDDFNRVKARWLWHQGDATAAGVAVAQSRVETAVQLRWCIAEACKAQKLSLAYAERVCDTKFGYHLDAATEDMLKQVLYTVNNRGRHSKRRAPSEEPSHNPSGFHVRKRFAASTAVPVPSAQRDEYTAGERDYSGNFADNFDRQPVPAAIAEDDNSDPF